MCTCADGWSCTQGGWEPPHVQEGGAAHGVGGYPCTQGGDHPHVLLGSISNDFLPDRIGFLRYLKRFFPPKHPRRNRLRSFGEICLNPNFGFQNSNLAITRRPKGLRSSRFQLSAYLCKLFLIRSVPGLNSFNLIDFMDLGMVRGGFEVGSRAVQGPSRVHPGSSGENRLR